MKKSPPGMTTVIAIAINISASPPAATHFKMGGDRGCEPMSCLITNRRTTGVASTAF
jgi:hypothetical protein